MKIDRRVSEIGRIAEEAEKLLADLSEEQLEGVRQSVRSGIEAIEAGRFTEYEGRDGLKILADKVKKNGRLKINARARRSKLK